MSKKLYSEIIAMKVKLTKIAMVKNYIQVEKIWMKISEKDLNYVKKHYSVGDFITIDYKCYSGGYHYIITKVYKKIVKKSKGVWREAIERRDYFLKHGKYSPMKKTSKKTKYKIFNDIMLSYGGYCGSVISEEVGVAFGLKKMQREVVEVEIKVKKGEIVIRRKR